MFAAVVAALWAAGSAAADSAGTGGDVSVAQTLGDRELTVVLRRVTSVPGPLRVDIVTHAGVSAGRLELAVTPVGASAAAVTPAPGVATAHTAVDLGGAPGMVSATVAVDRAGPWELAVDDGARIARIPFIVPAQVTSPPERLVYWGFLAAGVLLPVTVLVAVRARRTAWAMLPGAGMVAGVSVAVTAAVLSAGLPLPPQPGPQLDPSVDNVTHPYALGRPLTADYSRPPVLLTVLGDPPAAGAPGDLRLALADAATGAPVDDLVVHDAALIHLLIVGPGGELWHLHPIRTGPGRYEVRLTPPQPGRYAVSAELERRGGGIRMVRAATGLLVPGPATPAAAPGSTGPEVAGTPPILGGPTRTAHVAVAGGPVTITITDATAGTPITVTATVGDTPDLQPWLGMVGHMILAGPLAADTDLGAAVQQAPIWGHAHSMGGSATASDGMDMPGMDHSKPAVSPMVPSNGNAMLMAPANGESGPDETVAAYGPDVPFTFVFPVAGRYRVWIQVERHWSVLTVPFVLDVARGRP